MSGCLAWTLSEPFPDQLMVVELEPAGKGDLGSGRQHDLGVGATPGREKVAAVDHRGGKGAMVDQRSSRGRQGEPVAPRAPGA